MIKLKEILQNIVPHADLRYKERFQNPSLLTDEERDELNSRLDYIKSSFALFKERAILLYYLDRHVNFHPDKDLDVPLKMRDSNGNTIWAVIRGGRMVTIFARRDSQWLDYWTDPSRGRMNEEDLYYMDDDYSLKKIPYISDKPISYIFKYVLGKR